MSIIQLARDFAFMAHTNPLDNYNRKLGNKIALGRAIKNYNKGMFCTFELGI